MKIYLASENKTYGILFAIGLVIHLSYFAAIGLPSSLGKVQWAHADTETYVLPAKSFLQTGEFTVRGDQDSFRTIGYPLFLAAMMKLGAVTGLDWRILVYYAQAVIFAFIYPVIHFLAIAAFGLSRSVSFCCLGFMVVSGVFVSYTSVVLSDALFAVFLIAGIACGFHALKKRNVTWSVMYVVLITFAANVRPGLAMYPFAALCMHWAYIKHHDLNDGLGRILIIAMFALSMLGVQTPAIRNWIHYRVFTPSESGSMVLFNYLARDVLIIKNQNQRYEQVNDRLLGMTEPCRLGDRIAIRKKEAIAVFCEYPIQTMAFMGFYCILNSLEMHWNNTLFYHLRQTWYKDYADGTVRWSPMPFVAAMLFVVVYALIYSAALVQLFWFRKNIPVIMSVLLFIFPFILFCSTSYQGARFRLWFEPLVILAAAVMFKRIYDSWLLFRKNGYVVTPAGR